MPNPFMRVKQFIMLMISLMAVLPIMAQDTTPTPATVPFDPDAIPDFGRVVLSFEVPMDNNDFLLAKWVAVQPDLSRIYVGSGVAGIVYIFDDKGQLIGEVDTIYEFPPTDMIVGPDGNLYITQINNIYVYDQDGQRLREIPGAYLDDIIYTQVLPQDDKTMIVAQLFGDKDRLYHLDADGTVLRESERGFFSILNGDEYSQFDRITQGQDGYLYYFSDETKTMYQLDEDWTLRNQYNGLIAEPSTDPARSGVLVDEGGNVLLGDFGGVEIYGEKEQLVHTLKLANEFDFVHHMTFANNGLLVTVQPRTVSIIQYGMRDEEGES